MNRIVRSVLVALLVQAAPVVFATVASAATKAVCLVCSVKHGEAEEETVKATRTVEGKTYSFCSDKCAKEFDVDPAAYVPPEFPRPLPAFALADLAGRPLSPTTLAGKVVLLDFWATWCVPCRKAMPELQVLHDTYSDRGFAVVGISIDEDPKKVKKFVAAKQLSYPIAVDVDASPAWEAFRVKAVPASYLVNRDGQIVAQWTGAPPTREVLEAKLKELLAADEEPR